MRNIGALTLLELRSLYGINRILHTKDPKARRRYLLLAVAWVMVAGVVCMYVAGLVFGLTTLGLGNIVPAYLVIVASLLIFAFGLFTAGHRVFGQRGFDLLTSMPIRPGQIVVSRFLGMYGEDLALALLIMTPGIVTYGIFHGPGLSFYLIALAGTLLLPAIPLVAATLLGTLILGVSARMRHKSIIQTVLMVALLVGILLGSVSMGQFSEGITTEMLTNLAQGLGAMFERLYLPSMWLQNAMLEQSIGGFLLFAALSLLSVGLCVLASARLFRPIMAGLNRITARHSYKIGQMESRSMRKALFLREWKRYFSSGVYVTNTIVGPIMGTIMAGALCFVGMDTVTAAMPMDVTPLVPLAFSGVFCMMTTTSTAISMEGRQFWIIRSLPIPVKTLLDSKLLLNLSLMAPFYVLSEVFLVIALKPDFRGLIWLLVIPALVMVFSVVCGLGINLKLHRFDWDKEEQVVKQSLSAALGGFAGLLLCLLLAGILLAAPAGWQGLARIYCCLVPAAVTCLVYRSNNRVRLEAL